MIIRPVQRSQYPSTKQREDSLAGVYSGVSHAELTAAILLPGSVDRCDQVKFRVHVLSCDLAEVHVQSIPYRPVFGIFLPVGTRIVRQTQGMAVIPASLLLWKRPAPVIRSPIDCQTDLRR